MRKKIIFHRLVKSIGGNEMKLMWWINGTRHRVCIHFHRQREKFISRGPCVGGVATRIPFSLIARFAWVATTLAICTRLHRHLTPLTKRRHRFSFFPLDEVFKWKISRRILMPKQSFVLLKLETSRNSLEDTNESENDISRWNGDVKDRVFN